MTITKQLTRQETVIWNRLRARFPGLENEMDHTCCIWAARLENQENIRHYIGVSFNKTYRGQVTLYSPYLDGEYYSVRLGATKNLELCIKETMQAKRDLWDEYIEQKNQKRIKHKPKRTAKNRSVSVQDLYIPEPDISLEITRMEATE